MSFEENNGLSWRLGFGHFGSKKKITLCMWRDIDGVVSQAHSIPIMWYPRHVSQMSGLDTRKFQSEKSLRYKHLCVHHRGYHCELTPRITMTCLCWVRKSFNR